MVKSIDDIINEISSKRIVESLKRDETDHMIFERNESYRQARIKQLSQMSGRVRKYIEPGYIIEGYIIEGYIQ